MTKHTSMRQVLQSRALRISALVALVAADMVAAKYVGEHAADPIGATVLVGMAAMAGLCVALGPSFLMSLRRSRQRALGAWVVAAALIVSCWNLSSVIDAQRVEREALAVRADPAFAQDRARLTRLNSMIDATSDEAARSYSAGETYALNVAERDRLQARVDRAENRPVVIASFPAWARAFLFHGLVLGFSAAFALPPARAASKKSAKRRRVILRDGNVTFAQFSALTTSRLGQKAGAFPCAAVLDSGVSSRASRSAVEAETSARLATSRLLRLGCVRSNSLA